MFLRAIIIANLAVAILAEKHLQKEEPQQAYRPVKILRQETNINEDSAVHSYLYETENGIYEDQQGYPKDSNNLAVQGQIQFAVPNGEVIKLSYIADENGFQPQGDHLPTPPPIPPAIQRALKWLDNLPEERKKEIKEKYEEKEIDYDNPYNNEDNSFLLPPI